MQKAEVVLSVLRERGRRGLPLTQLYRQMFNKDLYLLAYGNIYSNEGAMTPGTGGETADGMSEEKIEEIAELMRQERYRFSPARRTYIPKKNGKLRPLGIPSWSDKLVGEVVMALAEDPQVCSAGFPTWLTLRVSGRLLFVACFAGVSRRRGDGGRGGRDEPGDDGDGLAAVRAGGDRGDGGVVVSARVVVLLAALAAVLRATRVVVMRVVAMRVVGLAPAAALAAGAVPPALAAGGGAEPLAGCGGGPGEFGAAGGAGSLFGAGHRVRPAVVALRMVSARCWWARMR